MKPPLREGGGRECPLVRFDARVSGIRVRLRAGIDLVGTDELAALVFGIAGVVAGAVGVLVGRAIAG